MASELIGVRCSVWTFLTGDYDGDGHRDLAMAWEQDCEPYFRNDFGGPAQVVTLLGGSSPREGLGLRYSPQPLMRRVAAGDFDGDDASELWIAGAPGELAILDWTAEGFVVTRTLTLPDDDDTPSFDGPRVGDFDGDGVDDGMFVGLGRVVDGVVEYRSGVLFMGGPEPEFAYLPGEPWVTFAGTFFGHFRGVADFDADGTADVMTIVDGREGVYVSLP